MYVQFSEEKIWMYHCTISIMTEVKKKISEMKTGGRNKELLFDFAEDDVNYYSQILRMGYSIYPLQE
jgi:hypothetical protein